MPWPNLTTEEKDWIKEHGCIHGMYNEDPIFCTKCKPDASDLLKLVAERCERIQNEKTL